MRMCRVPSASPFSFRLMFLRGYRAKREAFALRAGVCPSGGASGQQPDYLSGRARADSDLGLLAIEAEALDRYGEVAGLSKPLGRATIPTDVGVVSQAGFEH